MLRFAFPEHLVPPDLYRATMPDGHIVRQASRTIWYQEIKAHYQRNGYALPENWQAIYEDRLCRILPPGFAVNESGVQVNSEDIRIGIDDLKHGMQVLWNITRSPDPLVSKELAEKRGGICAACVANIEVPGCKPCIGLSNTIMDIKGRGSTKADAFLRSCAVCKCSNEAQIWVKKDILMTGVEGAQLVRMKELNPECWKADHTQP
jgi:hypothetical protein